MSAHLDESQLIELIESDMSGPKAPDLRRQLEADPRLKCEVEEMRAQRAMLKMLGDVEPPTNLVADLEPLMARPLLMDPVAPLGAGEYRRRAARARRRPMLARLALAAGFMFIVTGGVLAIVVAMNRDRQGGSGNGLALNDHAGQLEGVGEGSDGTAREANAPDRQRAVVHHQAPGAVDPAKLVYSSGRTAEGTTTLRAASPANAASAIALECQLVLHANTTDAARAAIERAVRATSSPRANVTVAGGASVTLVRNFSYEEALTIEREMLARNGGTSRGTANEPRTAGVNGSKRSTPADGRAWSEEIRRLAAAARERLQSGDQPREPAVLIGREQAGPSIEQQLALSEQGATLTMSISAGALSDVLASLAQDAAVEPRFEAVVQKQEPTSSTDIDAPLEDDRDPRLLGPGAKVVLSSKPMGSSGTALWLSNLAQLRQVQQQLAGLGPDVIVHVPIRIEPSKAQ